MKKLLFYLVILTALSCKKDAETSSIDEPTTLNSQLTIENARKILNNEKNQNKIHLVNPSEAITEKIKTKVSWANAVQYALNGVDVVEVPYKMDTLVVRDYAASSLTRKSNRTLSDFVQSTLIIYKKRTDSIVTMEVLKYIPGEESFNNPFYKIHSLSLNNLGEWTGYIEYSHTNGELFYLSKVNNGTIVNVKAAAVRKSSNRGEMNTQSGPCVVCIPKTVRICAGPYPGSPLEVCYDYPTGEECIDYCPGVPTIPPGGTVPVDSGVAPDGSVAYTIELQAFEVGYKAQMKPGELVIFNNMTRINQLRYLVNAQGAIELANELFPGNQTNTKADSFRHAYFSLWNTYSINRDLAKQLGDAHEEGTPANPMDEMAKSMDLWNNYAGRSLFSSISSSSLNRRDEFKNLVLSLMNAGELKYMKLVGLEYQLVYTNE